MVCALALGVACQGDDADGALLDAELTVLLETTIDGGAEAMRMPASDEYAAIPQDARNPLTAEKVTLGRLLFHETALGVDGVAASFARTYSCASCHSAAAGFQAGRHQGLGEGGSGFGTGGEGRERDAAIAVADIDAQAVRSPSILHAGYQRITHWNGQFGALGANEDTEHHWTPGTPKEINRLGYEGVETQAIAGLAIHRLDVDSVVLDDFGYRALFDEVFADVPAVDRYSRHTAGLAIAAYERTVLANRAPFQRWLAGEPNALSAAEKRGAIAFFGDADCASCHGGAGAELGELPRARPGRPPRRPGGELRERRRSGGSPRARRVHPATRGSLRLQDAAALTTSRTAASTGTARACGACGR